MSGLRLAHLYTLRHPELAPPGAPADWADEADTPDTHAVIAETLRALGHEVAVSIDTATAPLAAYERVRGCDLALNLAVGARGRDRESQTAAILELLGVPYLGSPPLAMALCLDKPRCKRLLRAAGVPTPPFQVARSADTRLAPWLRYPVFVKPAAEGSSKGVTAASLVPRPDALPAGLHTALAYGGAAVVEAYVPGREICTALMGPRALPALEVGFASGRGYSTSTDKEADLWDNLPVRCPADLPPDLARRLKQLTLRACAALGVRHMARLDFRWDGRGQPQLIDVNPIPTLRRDGSFYARAAAAAGLDYRALWAALLATAVGGDGGPASR